jgi:phosphoglycerol transferase MdoB-like AlkP superfamily enzyme
MECAHYTDTALKNFFAKIAKANFYKNTLFVITADHAATFAHFEEYQNTIGNYKVPVVFFDPSDTSQKAIDTLRIAQQIDIMPTVLDFLHDDEPFFAFGKSLRKKVEPEKDFVINYNGGFQFFLGDYVLLSDGETGKALYKYTTDPLLENNVMPFMDYGSMSLRLRAFIQQYYNRMIEDKLTP